MPAEGEAADVTSASHATPTLARGGKITPARAQYLAMKRQNPDALLLFRMGDFYETFDDDAAVVAEVLGIALTSRPMGGDGGRIPLAGIPYHALDRYLDRLVAAGHRVAIVEQTSPPGKGLVERRVVRVVTPGTVDAGSLLEERAQNWLVAAAPVRASDDAERWGIAACDVTTGAFECSVVAAAHLAGEWTRLRPRELLLASGAPKPAGIGDEVLLTERPARGFDPARAAEVLTAALGVASLDSFGLEGMDAAVGAAGALVRYLEEAWPGALGHLRAPRAVREQEHVYLDPQTRRNLDLFHGRREGEASLVETLDRTQTAMGGRLLRDRLGRPLRSTAAADARLDAVEALVRAPIARATLRRSLRAVGDLERLLGRVRAGTANARVLVQLRLGLEQLPALRAQAESVGGAAAGLTPSLVGVVEAAEAVRTAIADDPPAEIADGGTVRDGADAEVDALRALTTDARGALASLEAGERARTGLPLRVGFHRVFGYYWELPTSQAAKAPAEFEPRQTLANAQRFRSAALSALETRILGAREQLLEAERAVVERARAQVAEAGPAIAAAADAVAAIDVAASLAEVAAECGYVRPELADGGPLVIEGGRHPVVERRLPAGAFVPNDCVLGGGASGEGADIVLLSGPNMGGKSTYLRQVALCVLLAQCGSFVPADRARVPMADRIFSRVGAQDDIAAGQSTFMVEMVETAAILHNATERSLVILDEVGRGTATQDGLAIARAVVEYLHHRPGGTPRTLFATHFQELAALATVLPRVENRSVAVIEEGTDVIFLHRIVPGAADRSYGVHVAAIAGLPRAVVARARELLRELEGATGTSVSPATRMPSAALQPPLLPPVDPFVEAVASVEPDALTPLEALQRLYELRRDARRILGTDG